MRSLNRNKRAIYYALRTGETRDIDDTGFETGEVTPTYSNPVELECNISAATGSEDAQVFGTTSSYSRVICVADNSCPIDEDTIVWFGPVPPEPHNYIVIRKADSKNGVLYALREVNVK